jgi:tetratricopeptide (TPR) repeat protein
VEPTTGSRTRYDGLVDEMPLDEAVAKNLIPCSRCGAKGAAVRRIEGKPHFLCGACGRRNRWIVAAGTAVALAAVAFFAWRMGVRPGAPTPVAGAEDVERLLRAGRHRDARARLEAQIRAQPDDPRPLILLGHCLLNLGYTDGALDAFRRAVAVDPESASVGGLWIGMALQALGRAAEARPHLETPFPQPQLDDQRKASLVECLVDLELYDDALRLLGEATDPARLRARYRALRLAGRPADAEALLKHVGPKDLWTFRATQRREDGDFEGARQVLDAQRRASPEDRFKVARAAVALAADEGDLTRVLEHAAELRQAPQAQLRAEGLAFRAMAFLLAGNRDGARAAAEEFLSSVDQELSSLRLERLQMLHVLGKATTADVEAEAARVARVRANDLYWFLAAATEDRAWAEKGLAATPGRNFPYHALQRFAAK